uniref:Secreted protein n=1 Tax=Arundo donax TaxID=35708 RepID=A0A0A9E5Q1_ARUDO
MLSSIIICLLILLLSFLWFAHSLKHGRFCREKKMLTGCGRARGPFEGDDRLLRSSEKLGSAAKENQGSERSVCWAILEDHVEPPWLQYLLCVLSSYSFLCNLRG